MNFYLQKTHRWWPVDINFFYYKENREKTTFKDYKYNIHIHICTDRHDYANTKIRSNPFFSSLSENILNSFEVTLWSTTRRWHRMDTGWGGLIHGRWQTGSGVRTGWRAGDGSDKDETTESKRALATRGTEVRPSRSGPRSAMYASLTPTPSPATAQLQHIANSTPLPPLPLTKRAGGRRRQRGRGTHIHKCILARALHIKLIRASPHARGGGRTGNNA